MDSLRSVGAKSTYPLIQLYALIKKIVPEFRFMYINPLDQLRTLTMSANMQIIVYTAWNYRILEPTGRYIKSYELTEPDMFYLGKGFNKYDCKFILDFNKIVHSIQYYNSSYYIAENIENLSTCDFRNIISRNAFLCDRAHIVMRLNLLKNKWEIDIDEKLLASLLNSLNNKNNGIGGYIPYNLLREYAWTVSHDNKRFRLPYITPAKCIRNLDVPKCGINDIMVFTKDNFILFNNKQERLDDVFEQRGLFSEVYNRCYEIPYWDFMKLMATSFSYTVVDKSTGEIVDLKSVLYPIALMRFKGRSGGKIKNMYISLTV